MLCARSAVSPRKPDRQCSPDQASRKERTPPSAAWAVTSQCRGQRGGLAVATRIMHLPTVRTSRVRHPDSRPSPPNKGQRPRAQLHSFCPARNSARPVLSSMSSKSWCWSTHGKSSSATSSIRFKTWYCDTAWILKPGRHKTSASVLQDQLIAWAFDSSPKTHGCSTTGYLSRVNPTQTE